MAEPSLDSSLRRLAVWGILLMLGWSPPVTLALAGGDRLERISTGQGLSDSNVYDILQDHLGFLWIATQRGLNLYDGYHFTVYKHTQDDPNSLSHNYIETLYEDADGAVWVGTFNGLNRFDRKTNQFLQFFHHPEDPQTLSHSHIGPIFQDSAGELWIGTRQGLNKFNSNHQKFDQYRATADDPSGLAGLEISTLFEDHEQVLWLGTHGAGLFRLDRETAHAIALEIGPVSDDSAETSRRRQIQCLTEDRDGVLWIGSRAGLSSLGPNRRQWRPHPLGPAGAKSVSVQAIRQSLDGRLWIGTQSRGLYVFDRATGNLQHYQHDAGDVGSLSSNRIETIYEDASSILWIGTRGGGLSKIVRDRRNFELLRQDSLNPNRLINNQIRSIYVDSSQNLWIGTEGGLTRRRFGNEEAIHFQHDPESADSLSSNRIWAMTEDGDGYLWFGTKGQGLNRLDSRTERFTRFLHDSKDPTSVSHNDISVLHTDRSGGLWIGTYGGLNQFDHDRQRFSTYRHDSAEPASLSHDRITAIHDDEEGYLWIGTYVGLNRLDPANGEVRRYLRARSRPPADRPTTLSDNRVWTIFETRPGEIWIGTSGGVNKLDVETERFTHFTRSSGGPRDVVYSLLGDSEGLLWLGTSRGLSRLDPTTGSFEDFDISDGLQGSAFNPGAYFKTPQGELFFGGNNGLNRFKPPLSQGETAPPSIVLAGFKKFNKSVATESFIAMTDAISLSHKDYFVTFEFSILDYVRPEENRYVFKLEGFDRDWISIGTRRSATYTSLPAGRYRLMAKGSNSAGIWTTENLAIEVHVIPPFWETTWFRLVNLFALSALALSAYKVRTRSIQKRNRQLEETNAHLNEEIVRRAEAESENRKVIAEIQARNAEMERFTYTVSHDLKSPLITIQTFLSIVERDMAQRKFDRIQGDFQRIRGAASKMHQLLEELLDLARVGRLADTREWVGLGELAQEAVSLTSGRIRTTGTRIDIAPDLPQVQVDRARILEVLQNLIDNAVKYSASQPEPRVEIGHQQGDDGALFFVRDNGIGVDSKYQEKIFGLFEQLNPDGEGTGIGLALVRRIIEVHGGKIWVESKGQGQGTTVYFTLGDVRPGATPAASGESSFTNS